MIGARLKELIQILNENPNSFAEKLDISASIIYNIIGGRKSKPSFEILERIKQVYSQVNMNWLVSEQGNPVLVADNSSDVLTEIRNITNRIQQVEKLAEMRDQHISLLQNKLDTLKEKEESNKDKQANAKGASTT
jgi:transcriptional regulator with XRE-family HTH domain